MGDGKKSGVTADDVSRANDIADLSPAKSKAVQEMKVGDQHIDGGAVCDGKGLETPGCLFGDKQRERLIDDIDTRIGDASTNYKMALTQLQFEEMMKKEADLHWALSIALDLAGAHLIKVVANGVMALRSAGLAKLSTSFDGKYLSDKTTHARADEMLRSVDDKFVREKVKTVIDPLKKGAANTTKQVVNVENANEKASTLSFIQQLESRCDVGFRAFGSEAKGHANDAELFVIWEGLRAENHTVAEYKQALAAKITRYKESGINDVGRQKRKDREFGFANVIRDTRAVWVRETDGTKILHYQSVDASYNPTYIRRGDPDSGDLLGNADKHLTFGDRERRAEAKLDGRVPLEFVDLVLARSEEVWGPTPVVDRGVNLFVPQPKAPQPSEPSQAPRGNGIDSSTPRSVEPDWDTLPDVFKTTGVR